MSNLLVRQYSIFVSLYKITITCSTIVYSGILGITPVGRECSNVSSLTTHWPTDTVSTVSSSTTKTTNGYTIIYIEDTFSRNIVIGVGCSFSILICVILFACFWMWKLMTRYSQPARAVVALGMEAKEVTATKKS